MTDSTSPSPWRTAWHWIREYWHWPVLAGAALYVYLLYFPIIDVSDPGSPVPPFEAETLDGSTFRLADHRGEVVVVNVWASWCGPCRVEMPGFVRLSEEMDGVQFVGVAVDRNAPDAVRQFVDEYDVRFPQIADPSLAARLFPGSVVPRTYLIDADGRLRYTHEGIIMPSALRDGIDALQSNR